MESRAVVVRCSDVIGFPTIGSAVKQRRGTKDVTKIRKTCMEYVAGRHGVHYNGEDNRGYDAMPGEYYCSSTFPKTNIIIKLKSIEINKVQYAGCRITESLKIKGRKERLTRSRSEKQFSRDRRILQIASVLMSCPDTM